MKSHIKTRTLGKLRIYLTPGEKAPAKRLLHKFFPKKALHEMIVAAKEAGILNANVFHAHLGYSNNRGIRIASLESANDELTVCLELIDEREKLETFFRTHKEILQDKVVVYKPVEFWEF
jgi:PII-like signaling protein